MMTKRFSIACLIFAGGFSIASAFWSLESDLQLGYEIYDRSYEISAAVQAIVAATTRNNIIQADSKTAAGLEALAAIRNQLQSAPSAFLNELAYAAASRTNSEQWHIDRLRNNHAAYMNALETLANSTGALGKLGDITNPSIMSNVYISLARIHEHSRDILIHAETVTLRVSQVRANASLLLTPRLLDEFIGVNGTELTTSLVQLRNSYLLLLMSVRDAARLTAAHGSMYDIMDKSTVRDVSARNKSLFNFVSNYNRVRSTLLSSVVSYRQSAQSGFASFIQRVQSNYDDTIVRPRFDNGQLQALLSFADVVTKRVYNQTFFETSFDGMRDAIVEAYESDTSEVISQDSQYRDMILNLMRESFVRRYASCLNELVSEAQQGLNVLTEKYSFCLDERTTSITVVIPSTSSWLSVIRDNVNFILQQLNACLSGGNSVAARTAVSACIQSNANNLQFYAMYLPLTVETNLRPIVQSPPLIFRNCINVIRVVAEEHVDKFDEAYERCSNEAASVTTTGTEEPMTTESSPATTEEPMTTENSPATTEEPSTSEDTTASEEHTATSEDTTTEESVETTPDEVTESIEPTTESAITDTDYNFNSTDYETLEV